MSKKWNELNGKEPKTHRNIPGVLITASKICTASRAKIGVDGAFFAPAVERVDRRSGGGAQACCTLLEVVQEDGVDGLGYNEKGKYKKWRNGEEKKSDSDIDRERDSIWRALGKRAHTQKRRSVELSDRCIMSHIGNVVVAIKEIMITRISLQVLRSSCMTHTYHAHNERRR